MTNRVEQINTKKKRTRILWKKTFIIPLSFSFPSLVTEQFPNDCRKWLRDCDCYA